VSYGWMLHLMTKFLRGSDEQIYSHGSESLQASTKCFRVIWDEGGLRKCSASNRFLHSVKINETKPINFGHSENAACGGAVCLGTWWRSVFRHVVAQCV